MMREGFAGEAFSDFNGGEGDGYTSQQRFNNRGLRKMERAPGNNEFVYDNSAAGAGVNYEDQSNQDIGAVTYDDTTRV